MIDKAATVRAGEELELSALVPYLAAIDPAYDHPCTVQQFPHGYSNLTYLLSFREHQLVLRRPPFGANIRSGHDMSREFRILSAVHPLFSKVPRPVHLCEDESILGASFYVMERVEGTIVRKNRMSLGMSADFYQRFSVATADCLAEIHSIDVDAAGLRSFGRPQGYVKRQIEGWSRRYLRAQTDVLNDMEHVSRWLHENMPSEAGVVLVHNDYKYDNLILDSQSQQIKVVLDWEMATIGCPLMDLGAALGYWLQATDDEGLHHLPLCPTYLPGNISRRDFALRYAEKTGRDIPNLLFYYVYGVWRIAVIIQQIYARYRKGYTQDPRFANLGEGVRLLLSLACHALDKGRV